VESKRGKRTYLRLNFPSRGRGSRAGEKGKEGKGKKYTGCAGHRGDSEKVSGAVCVSPDYLEKKINEKGSSPVLRYMGVIKEGKDAKLRIEP